MFWNWLGVGKKEVEDINRKHEMFWNNVCVAGLYQPTTLTVNMKCFEIGNAYAYLSYDNRLTVNMKCFEMCYD